MNPRLFVASGLAGRETLVRVVVTGGAGFIGANLCRVLSNYSEVTELIAFDDLSTGDENNLGKLSVPLIRASVNDSDAVGSAIENAHAVVHLAARASVPSSLAEPVATHDTNVTGTVNVLEAARRTGAAVITASSSAVYGASPALPKDEEMATRPVSPYGASKLAAEAYTLAYGSSFRMRTVAFRLFNVFGPLQSADHPYAPVVPAFLDAVMTDRPITIYGDGLQSRDFSFVDSVCHVLASAVIRRLGHATPVNLAFGTRVTLLGVVQHLEKLLGRKLERVHLPVRSGDIRASQASPTLCRSLFPEIHPVDLDTGLRRTLEWAAHRHQGRRDQHKSTAVQSFGGWSGEY